MRTDPESDYFLQLTIYCFFPPGRRIVVEGCLCLTQASFLLNTKPLVKILFSGNDFLNLLIKSGRNTSFFIPDLMDNTLSMLSPEILLDSLADN